MSTTHCGYVVKVKELRPHRNADKLQIAKFFDCETCVGLDVNLVIWVFISHLGFS